MSRVQGRRNPITGAIVVADVAAMDGADHEMLRAEILADCRQSLAAFKVPTLIRFVPSLPLNANGKLERAFG
jgi:acyl-coenzyme A synthetase/AMP-(fatty) acid ligase